MFCAYLIFLKTTVPPYFCYSKNVKKFFLNFQSLWGGCPLPRLPAAAAGAGTAAATAPTATAAGWGPAGIPTTVLEPCQETEAQPGVC
jgi:hypothetical protein